MEMFQYLLMKSEASRGFNSNILKIALNMKETMIASVLVQHYKMNMERDMLVRAIKTGQMTFLYCVFAFNQNFYENEDAADDSDESHSDSSSPK